MSWTRRAVIGPVAILVGACMACSDDQGARPSEAHPAQPSTALAATAASVTPSPAAARSAATPLVRPTAPAVASGELTRAVFSREGGTPGRGSSINGTARSGVEYEVRGTCTASNPDHVVAYDIQIAKADSSEPSVASGMIPCDGSETVDGLSALPSSVPLTIRITGLSDVTHAYAIVAPRT